MNSYEFIKNFLKEYETTDEEMDNALEYLQKTNWKARALAKEYPNWYENNVSIMKQMLNIYRTSKEIE